MQGMVVPYSLYRIAETSFGVATDRAGLTMSCGEQLEDGVSGALDSAGRSETPADFSEAAAEGLAGGLVV